MTFSQSDKYKLRAAFLTYALLKSKEIRISEFCEFINNYDFGLNCKSVSSRAMAQIITKDCFLMKNLDIEKKNGVNVFSLKKE